MQNIGVIFGGNSVEHEISIISALQAIENIDKTKYQVVPIYLTKQQNKFYSSEDFFNINTFKNIDNMVVNYKPKKFIKRNNQVFLEDEHTKFFTKNNSIEIDVFFPIVHGTNVEDGKLQGFLSMFEIPVVGPTTLSGAIGQDKAVAKDLLKAYDISQTDYIVLHEDEIEDVKSKVCNLQYPLIIKPNSLGSSIGIQIVEEESELVAKVKEAFSYDNYIVIENKLPNIRELNISVYKYNSKIEVSAIEEVYSQDLILSFEDKYMSGAKGDKSQGMASTTREIPAKISKELSNEIENLAKRTYNVLRCVGVIRVDIILVGEKLYINEVNNIPGSLSYYLWEPKDIDYKQLLSQLIESAIKDKYLRQNKTTSYKSNVLNAKSLKLNK